MLLACRSRAQTTLNVTNSGAVGDAMTVHVFTTAGSTTIGFTNAISSADIGKTVEISDVGETNWGVNTPTLFAGATFITTNWQDYIAVITAVSGTNATITLDGVYNPATGGGMTSPPQFTANFNNIITGSPSYDGNGNYTLNGLNPGWTYTWTPGAHDTNIQGATTFTTPGTITTAGQFQSISNSVVLSGLTNATVTATVSPGLALCTYGTDNRLPFANCIAAAPTNATIYIPHGTLSPWGATNAYLLMPPGAYTNWNENGFPLSYYYFLTNAGVMLERGGLFFTGDGQGQSILLAQGAWKAQLQGFGGGYYRGARGAIVGGFGPVTNNYPVVFSNLTFDGGVQLGLADPYSNEEPANGVDGVGWDNGAHAIYTTIINGEPLWNSMTAVNCEFRHWRGEMIGNFSGTATTENWTVISNVLYDGEASALNIEVANATIGNKIYSLYQGTEDYVGYIVNAPSYFLNNWMSNCAHNFYTMNGGSSTNLPMLVSNNTFVVEGSASGTSGGVIQTAPAANLTIANNLFSCTNPWTAIDLGVAGSQGSWLNSNIDIAGNYFDNPETIVLLDGHSFGIANVLVSNNVLAPFASHNVHPCDTFPSMYTNITFADNNFYSTTLPGVFFTSGFYPDFNQQFALVLTNTYYYHPIDHETITPATNAFSYGQGPWYQTIHTTTNDAFELVDTNGPQIPLGAQIVLDNTTNNGGNNGIYTIFENTAHTRSVMSTNGMIVIHTWDGTQWSLTNGTPPPPPGHLILPLVKRGPPRPPAPIITPDLSAMFTSSNVILSWKTTITNRLGQSTVLTGPWTGRDFTQQIVFSVTDAFSQRDNRFYRLAR